MTSVLAGGIGRSAIVGEVSQRKEDEWVHCILESMKRSSPIWLSSFVRSQRQERYQQSSIAISACVAHPQIFLSSSRPPAPNRCRTSTSRTPTRLIIETPPPPYTPYPPRAATPTADTSRSSRGNKSRSHSHTSDRSKCNRTPRNSHH